MIESLDAKESSPPLCSTSLQAHRSATTPFSGWLDRSRLLNHPWTESKTSRCGLMLTDLYRQAALKGPPIGPREISHPIQIAIHPHHLQAAEMNLVPLLDAKALFFSSESEAAGVAGDVVTFPRS